MALVSHARLALKKAKDAKGNSLAYGHDFSPAKIKGGKGIPQVALNLWGVPGSLSMRGYKRELKAKETAKGFEFDLQNPGRLVIEQRDSLQFPDGAIFLPEMGLLATNLVIDAPGEWSWQFDLELPGCSWVYQPALTSEEIDDGCVRPSWCVGSWAIFDSVGIKVGHLSRPFARDADGNWTWGVVSIDRGGTITVTMPKAWMDSAKYPVVVDPDMGFTGLGGSSANLSANQMTTNAVGGGVGTATGIHVYCNYVTATAFTLGLYGVTGSLLAQTAESTAPSSAQWRELTLSENYTLTNGASIFAGINVGGIMTMYYDTIVHAVRCVSTNTYSSGVMPDPAPSSGTATTRYYSFHVPFTEASSGGLLAHGGMTGGMNG